MSDDFESELRRFSEKVFIESHEVVDWATAPITFLHKLEADSLATTFDRSGVLLAIGELRFLITAEHDILKYRNAGYIPCIAAPRPDVPPTPLVADKLYVSDDPLVDIAVFSLVPDTVENLKGDYRFLRLNQVRITPPSNLEGAFFLVTGFPADMQDYDEMGRERVNVAKFVTCPLSGRISDIENFIPEAHIVLGYEKDAKHTSGNRVPPPRAPGLSGCGIWYLPIPQGMQGWTQKAIVLYGVQTAWHRQREYVKGTVIGHALAMIWCWFSDSRDPMRINGFEYTRGRMRVIR